MKKFIPFLVITLFFCFMPSSANAADIIKRAEHDPSLQQQWEASRKIFIAAYVMGRSGVFTLQEVKEYLHRIGIVVTDGTGLLITDNTDSSFSVGVGFDYRKISAMYEGNPIYGKIGKAKKIELHSSESRVTDEKIENVSRVFLAGFVAGIAGTLPKDEIIDIYNNLGFFITQYSSSRAPSFRVTVKNRQDIVYNVQYDPNTGMVTLDHGESRTEMNGGCIKAIRGKTGSLGQSENL